MRMYGGKLRTEQQIAEYREKKKLLMQKRRSDPETRNKINAQTRKWYKESGRAERQKQYLIKLRTLQFFRWRTRLFNMHYGTSYTPLLFQKIWYNQNCKCALTGKPLDDSSQIDHIIPLKKGGSSEINNLRWVCKEVNLAKRNLTDNEFYSLCNSVIEFLGRQLLHVENQRSVSQ